MTNENIEMWLDVPGYEGHYEVSSHGRVRGLRSGVLSPWRGKYLAVTLKRSGVGQTLRLHKMVMLAFVGPCPRGQEVRHLNGDAIDNRLVNLAYGTPSENRQDTLLHGRHPKANKTHCPEGHPYSGDNLILTQTGGRACRECRRARARMAARRRRLENREHVNAVRAAWRARRRAHGLPA